MNQMHDCKMIITDLDGTLLRDDKCISDKTISVLQRCHEKGIRIAYATARSENACRAVRNSFDPDAVVINGGAAVFAEGRQIVSQLIPKAFVRRFVKYCMEHIGTGFLTVDTQQAYYINQAVNEEDPLWRDYFPVEVVDMREGLYIDAYKVTVALPHTLPADVLAETFPQMQLMRFSGENWCSFVHKQTSKWQAVTALAQHYGMHPDQIVAFGDDYSDIPMLEKCGTGVAMGNAIAAVRQISDTICRTNEEDGVACWLEEYLL